MWWCFQRLLRSVRREKVRCCFSLLMSLGGPLDLRSVFLFSSFFFFEGGTASTEVKGKRRWYERHQKRTNVRKDIRECSLTQKGRKGETRERYVSNEPVNKTKALNSRVSLFFFNTIINEQPSFVNTWAHKSAASAEQLLCLRNLWTLRRGLWFLSSSKHLDFAHCRVASVVCLFVCFSRLLSNVHAAQNTFPLFPSKCTFISLPFDFAVQRTRFSPLRWQLKKKKVRNRN